MVPYTPSFGWIPVYGALAEQIRLCNNDQGKSDLLEFCQRELNDEVTYIDPFALFLSFNKTGGGKTRIDRIAKLQEYFGVREPFDGDLAGIPTAYQQFGIIAHNENDAKTSWELFCLVVDKGQGILEDPRFASLMNKVVSFNDKRNYNDLTKLLYTINPRVFFPLHDKNNQLVKENFGIDPKAVSHHSAEGYIDFIRQLKSATDTPFWILSHQADPHFATEHVNGLNQNLARAIQAPAKTKNIILYGPPGTGKTYSVVELAWSIAHNNEKATSHQEAKDWYDAQLDDKEGQVDFVTFHQSFSYEDFIEGIRPILYEDKDDAEGALSYQIADGIFKTFCEKAAAPSIIEEFGLSSSPTVWKVSLNGTGSNPVRTECLENGHIRIGWDSYGPNIDDQNSFPRGGKQVLNAFLNKMNIGDIVVSCYSATNIDAIGIITGGPEWHDEYDGLKRQRSVNWLVRGINYNIVERFGIPNMTLATIYQLRLTKKNILDLISETTGQSDLTTPNTKPYIFVIDEINRGNISRIFGELITLIEESRRIGESDAQTAILPYSKTKFAIPSNIYLIGTMNTADRSLVQLDTALRRRFSFIEIAPDPTQLKGIDCEGIDLQKILEAMNARIRVLYDRDHAIGHTYFRDIDSFNKLKERFSLKIIPLLQEYFYDDYEKIRQVLNDTDNNETGFVISTSNDNEYLKDLEWEAPLSINDKRNWTLDDFKRIYHGEAREYTEQLAGQ